MTAGQASNLEIAAAISRVHQAEAQGAYRRCTVSAECRFPTSINRALPLASNGSALISTSGLLKIGYKVDFWGKNKAGLVAAEASLQANRYDRETVALTVTSGIVSTYLQVEERHQHQAAKTADHRHHGDKVNHDEHQDVAQNPANIAHRQRSLHDFSGNPAGELVLIKMHALMLGRRS